MTKILVSLCLCGKNLCGLCVLCGKTFRRERRGNLAIGHWSLAYWDFLFSSCLCVFVVKISASSAVRPLLLHWDLVIFHCVSGKFDISPKYGILQMSIEVLRPICLPLGGMGDRVWGAIPAPAVFAKEATEARVGRLLPFVFR